MFRKKKPAPAPAPAAAEARPAAKAAEAPAAAPAAGGAAPSSSSAAAAAPAKARPPPSDSASVGGGAGPADPPLTSALKGMNIGDAKDMDDDSDLEVDGPDLVGKVEREASSGSLASASSKRQSISYAAERVIGNGSFGVVYQATVIETGDTVAIKKVLQDRRFKNRELQVMRTLDHPCVVKLRHSFLARGERHEDVYLNLVMEFVPETIHRTLRNHTKAKKLVPLVYAKIYMYQVCRALAYIHSIGICHRDIKPQNLLLDPNTHVVKLCDFGSAKVLVKGQPNVAYICSRYYRAPELVFEATEYSTAIDIWSLGCVLAELLLGKPLFPGDSGVDQLIEIIKILGTPTREEIFAMNPNHTSFSFPQIAPHPWSKVFRNKAPPEAIDLVSRFLQYKPEERLDPFRALAHDFFNELREPEVLLPNGKKVVLPPTVFNFTRKELTMMVQLGLVQKLIPPHVMEMHRKDLDEIVEATRRGAAP